MRNDRGALRQRILASLARHRLTREDWRGFALAAYGDAWWRDRATLVAVATDLERIETDTWRTDIARLKRHIDGAPLSA